MMKKFYIFILCIIYCIFALNMHTLAQGKADSQNWYLKYNKDEIPPQTPDNGSFTKQYDVISLDKSGEKSIYLTFDAGYENGNVEKILDILDKHNVKGAFFVLPHLIESSPALVQRMNDNKHLICNHTRSHKNMSKITDFNVFKKELTDNEDILRNTLGIEMAKYYRPPEGAYSEANLEFAKNAGYKTVFWSLAYADWDNNKQPDAEKSLNLLLSRVHPGCVALFHPTSETNVKIMDRFIETLKAKGYTFKSLDEFKF